MIEIIFWSVLATFMALGAIANIAMITAGLVIGVVHYGILS